MTTIAYRDGVLAADRCSWSGSARRRVRKVFKVRSPDGRSYLVAFAGDGMFALAVLAWMRFEREAPDAAKFVKSDSLDNQCALVIDERKRIYQLSYALNYGRSMERIYAFGGGQEFAWGALEAGASAVEAVRIAIKRSDYAGLGVDSVRF